MAYEAQRMTYEFQGKRYRTESEMLLALASEYLSESSLYDEGFQQWALAKFSDEELAADCIQVLGLSEPDPLACDRTWLEVRDLDRSDIEAAFYDIRARF